jgi:hypothetical protein
LHCESPAQPEPRRETGGQGGLTLTAKIVLNLVVVTGKIKGEQSFLRLKNQSPGQPGSALVNRLSQFSDGNTEG